MATTYTWTGTRIPQSQLTRAVTEVLLFLMRPLYWRDRYLQHKRDELARKAIVYYSPDALEALGRNLVLAVERNRRLYP